MESQVIYINQIPRKLLLTLVVADLIVLHHTMDQWLWRKWLNNGYNRGD